MSGRSLVSDIERILVLKCGRDAEFEQLWEFVFDEVWVCCDELDGVII